MTARLHTDFVKAIVDSLWFLSPAGLPVQMLISYLHAWGIPNNDIILEPLLRPHNQHYSGVLFQLHLLDQQDSGGTSLMAVGKHWTSTNGRRWAQLLLLVLTSQVAVG